MWQVSKRSNELQPYSKQKILMSIAKAQENMHLVDEAQAKEVTRRVVRDLKEHLAKESVISTSDIGDTVERILIERSYYDLAKAYIIARERQRQERRAGRGLGVKDDLGLSYNQLVVIANKYLQKDNSGAIIETPKEMFERVSAALASAEKYKPKYWEKLFYQVMTEFRFLPGGRTLANAGTVNNQLANCFVMPMPDSVEGIFDIVKESSILKKNGGGVGFNLGKIRPKGDVVATTSGRAAGPIAVMHILNHASDMLLQAGGRRSGNMIVLPVSHPDIFEFLTCKEEENVLNHINFSLGITSKFMKAVEKDEDWNLINPRNGDVVNTVSARSIFELAATMAWKNGDPGMIFMDQINTFNPTPQVGPLESVNLCGEQPLLSYEACNLGSINLAAHLRKVTSNKKHTPAKSQPLSRGDKQGISSREEQAESRGVSVYEVDWDKLKETIHTSVRMLDDVVTVCTYPLKKVDDTVKSNRKIGLGVMGWADLLVRMQIPYSSDKALKLAEEVAKFIDTEGQKASRELAKERGPFPNWKGSLWQKMGRKPQRNATITTIAPTGSIAMTASCSYGVEPHFALAFYKQAMGGYKLPEVNKDLMKHLEKLGLAENDVIDELLEHGTIQHIEKVPQKIRDIFQTAHDLKPEDHVKMQAAWQKYTDNAVSKTINMPSDTNVDDVADALMLAWKTKCKGITVYRDTSRSVQVLNVGKTSGKRKVESGKTNGKRIEKGDVRNERSQSLKSQVSNLKSKECPQCGAELQIHEGCMTCPACAFSACSV